MRTNTRPLLPSCARHRDGAPRTRRVLNHGATHRHPHGGHTEDAQTPTQHPKATHAKKNPKPPKPYPQLLAPADPKGLRFRVSPPAPRSPTSCRLGTSPMTNGAMSPSQPPAGSSLRPSARPERRGRTRWAKRRSSAPHPTSPRCSPRSPGALPVSAAERSGTEPNGTERGYRRRRPVQMRPRLLGSGAGAAPGGRADGRRFFVSRGRVGAEWRWRFGAPRGVRGAPCGWRHRGAVSRLGVPVPPLSFAPRWHHRGAVLACTPA